MCDFISWVEIKEEEKKEIFYLTDKEVFSKEGKEKLKGSLGSDFIGHAAIRTFFDLGERGRDREINDFWKLNRLPKELRLKIKNFDKYWGKMFKRCFYYDDLCDIVRYAPDEWKVKASQQLLKQGPSNESLRAIIIYAPDEWKAKASQQLLKQGPSFDDLKSVIKFAPDKWKKRAEKFFS